MSAVDAHDARRSNRHRPDRHLLRLCPRHRLPPAAADGGERGVLHGGPACPMTQTAGGFSGSVWLATLRKPATLNRSSSSRRTRSLVAAVAPGERGWTRMSRSKSTVHRFVAGSTADEPSTNRRADQRTRWDERTAGRGSGGTKGRRTITNWLPPSFGICSPFPRRAIYAQEGGSDG